MPPEDSIPEANVIPIRNRMTVVQYDSARAELRATFGDSSIEAAAKRDQALALLFERSGWTQQELAEKEGRKQPWIAQRLRFGRFLNFITTVINADSLPANLTEGRFREFWEQTDQSISKEDLRFRAALKLMHAESITKPRRAAIGGKIKDAFADGKWHNLAVIADKIDVDQDHVRETLDGICKNQNYGCKAEKKHVGDSFAYRVFKLDRAVSTSELLEKLQPIIKGLESEGRASKATASPPNVLLLAHRLRKLLDEWTQ